MARQAFQAVVAGHPLALKVERHGNLDTLRKLRNSKYTEFTSVNRADLQTAVESTDRVRRETEAWLLREMDQRRR